MTCTSKTILVIDDMPFIRDIVATSLTKKNFTVFEAKDIEQATAIIADHNIDIVITDIILPHKDGVRIIMDLRTKSPAIKIIAMSGAFNKEKFLELAKNFGAHEILCKPFKANELLAAVEKVLLLDVPSLTQSSL